MTNTDTRSEARLKKDWRKLVRDVAKLVASFEERNNVRVMFTLDYKK